MKTADLEKWISAEVRPYRLKFSLSGEQVRIPDVLTALLGSIDGHPVRFDFHGPKSVDTGAYLILIFDIRTKNEIGNASSPSGFMEALARIDWPNAIGALTH